MLTPYKLPGKLPCKCIINAKWNKEFAIHENKTRK